MDHNNNAPKKVEDRGGQHRATRAGAYMMHAQDKIGWNLALEGVLTIQWHTQQDQYWQWIKS